MPFVRRFGELREDVTFAARQLRKSPGFAFVVVITLALGVGVNSAIFALVDATLLRPLPLPGADRLVMVWERSATSPRDLASPLNMTDWNQRSRAFEKMAAFVPNVGGMVMAGADGTADTVPRQWVTAGVFDVLGIRAIAGRTFVAADEAGGPGAVVLSEAFWRARFGGNHSVIGRELLLDGSPFTVVGVVPQEAQLLGASSIWAVRPMPRDPRARAAHFLRVVGRLKPGVAVEAAAADMTAVADGLSREFPATNKGRGVALEPFRDVLIGDDLRLTSTLFLGIVGFVLLICCVNVANLLLSRMPVRARELAVRFALGASRPRIIRQLLTESLVLAALGGLLGVAVGAAILKVAPSVIPEGLLPGAVTLSLDARVLAFCAGVTLLVGLMFGLGPAWQATSLSPVETIGSGGRTSTRGDGRLRRMMVVGEVAAAALLLTGAGLLLRTLLTVDGVDRGYRARQVLTMMVDPLGSQYPTRESLVQFLDEVEGQVRALPGVEATAWTSALPFGPSVFDSFYFEIVGDPPVEAGQRPTALYQPVSAAYFRAIDLPLVAGRAFDDRDTGTATPVCIVNEAFVRRHLQGRPAIGARVAVRPEPAEPAVVREVVGVARQVKGRPDEREDIVQLYVPSGQDPVDDIYLMVRPAAGPAEALAPSVRAAIGRVDRAQLVSVRDVMTLEDVASDATSRYRFRAVMVVTFALLALILAMVGVFGILASSVQQRVREFGVRMALGASLRDVLGLVAGGAVRMIGLGAFIGLGLAAALGRLLTTVLFGVHPWDPVTFLSVALVLSVTAAAASAVPAWRAARIQPAVALRSE
ncbi:MAG: ABC transporter permease [Acidobacteria bacterium]|nr:MAG: ABC transporter permease [Acidobacteriota bacterium]